MERRGHHLRRGSGEDQEGTEGTKTPRAGGRGTLPNTTLSPPVRFCTEMGSDESRFNVFINRDGQSAKTVSLNDNF